MTYLAVFKNKFIKISLATVYSVCLFEINMSAGSAPPLYT